MLGISDSFLFPQIEKKCNAIKMQVKNGVDEKFDILSADEQEQ